MDDEETLALWRSVQLMHLQLTALLHHGLVADVGLTYQDFVVLSELSNEPRRVVDLAQTLGLEKSRLSHHLDRMVARGLVARRPTPGDARGTCMVLTPKGRRMHAKALPTHLDRVRRLFGVHVSTREANALRSLLEKVEAAISS
jgi:DNA-binding MarR family transcriptional regulator